MNECIFCKIVKGEIPSYKVWEDENYLAFLDVFPATKGHTLIIPKKHYKDIFEIPKEKLNRINEISKEIANILKEKLNAEGINILNSSGKVAQQDVFHYHLHVIPRYSKDKFKIEFKNKTENKNFEEIIKIIK